MLEPLESRVAPATCTWSGGGTTAKWSDPKNWDTTPSDGRNDALIFPASSKNFSSIDDFSSLSVASIAISGPYQFRFTAGAGASFDASTVTLNSDATFAVDSGTSVRFLDGGSQILGAGKLTKGGVGQLIFQPQSSSPNTNGTIAVDTGDLTIGNSSALPTMTFNTVSGATLTAGSDTITTIGALSGDGTLNLVPAQSDFDSSDDSGSVDDDDDGDETKLTIGANGTSTSFGGPISGQGILVKTGPGAFTLSPNATTHSTFQGGFFLKGGLLHVGGSDPLPGTTDLTVAPDGSGGTPTLDLQAFAVHFATATLANNSAVTLALQSNTQYGFVQATGAVTIGSNVTLGIRPSFSPASNTTFTILRGSSLTGQFAGLAEGATVYGGGMPFLIHYSSTAVTLTRVAAQTNTAIGSSSNPAVFSQAITFRATVAPVSPATGTPTGTVQFQVDGSNLGAPVTLSGGSAVSPPVSNLSVKSHVITAVYTSDQTIFASSAGMLAGGQMINAAGTSVGVSSSANPSMPNQPVTFTATVSGTGAATGTPTGTVQFLVDGSNFGTPVPLAGGVAQSGATTSLAIGSHTVSASYSSDTSGFLGSQGSLQQGQAVAANTAVVLSSSTNPSTYEQPITITATVNAVAPATGTPSGTVQFVIDGNPLGTPVSLSGGVATSPAVSTLSVGSSHAVTAQFVSNSPSFANSVGTLAGGQIVNAAGTVVTVLSSQNPAHSGTAVVFTATVSAVSPASDTPTGSVQFVVDGTNRDGPMVLSAGSVKYTLTSALSPGSHSIAVMFTSDSANFANSSGNLTSGQTIGRPIVPIGSYNGDGRTDLATFGHGGFTIERPDNSGADFIPFGGPLDRPINADFDGDGRADLAAIGPYGPKGGLRILAIKSNGTGIVNLPFGGPLDTFVTGDFDGDGKSDFAVYGPYGPGGFHRLIILQSKNGNVLNLPFGGPQDVFISGDFDGDGKTDFAVYGPYGPNGRNRLAGVNSGGGFFNTVFGGPLDTFISGDFDGDGRTDLAVYGPYASPGFNRWAIIKSSGGAALVVTFGALRDRAVLGDYDGDGKTDFGVYGPYGPGGTNRFLVVGSGGSVINTAVGQSADVPLPVAPNIPALLAQSSKLKPLQAAVVHAPQEFAQTDVSMQFVPLFAPTTDLVPPPATGLSRHLRWVHDLVIESLGLSEPRAAV